MELIKTPAEREREKSLLEDPYARVINPSFVQCRQCLKKIKLSSKSAYDTFHWRNHRARCIRAMKKKLKAAATPMAPRRRVLATASPKNTASPRPLYETKRPITPPLVSDSDEDQRSERSAETQSPTTSASPLFPDPSALTPHIGYSDPSNIDEYLLRSHPECVQSARPIHVGDHGRNWSWSQLKQPHFAAAPVRYADGDNDDGEDEDESMSVSQDHIADADKRRQEAALTLSMLSRSR
ncbi:hypothetical protein BDZ97DRAFT_706407 [Flammula alnicola]|nr:hypothetical protein BDZ97DRAFT_706407 [Flammula alnicola]